MNVEICIKSFVSNFFNSGYEESTREDLRKMLSRKRTATISFTKTKVVTTKMTLILMTSKHSTCSEEPSISDGCATLPLHLLL